MRGLLLLAQVALTAALTTVLIGVSLSRGASPPARPLPKITSRTPLYAVERHFGHPTQSQFNAGKLTNVYISRRHNWTVVLFIHPAARPHG